MLMATDLPLRIRETGVDRGVIVVGFVSEGCLLFGLDAIS